MNGREIYLVRYGWGFDHIKAQEEQRKKWLTNLNKTRERPRRSRKK